MQFHVFPPSFLPESDASNQTQLFNKSKFLPLTNGGEARDGLKARLAKFQMKQLFVSEEERSSRKKNVCMMSTPRGAVRDRERRCKSHTTSQQLKERQQGETFFLFFFLFFNHGLITRSVECKNKALSKRGCQQNSSL